MSKVEVVEVEVTGTVILGMVIEMQDDDTDEDIATIAKAMFEEHATFDADMLGDVLTISTSGIEATVLEETQ